MYMYLDGWMDEWMDRDTYIRMYIILIEQEKIVILGIFIFVCVAYVSFRFIYVYGWMNL
jgi:hypothetical protein